jgi:hypothetical protein
MMPPNVGSQAYRILAKPALAESIGKLYQRNANSEYCVAKANNSVMCAYSQHKLKYVPKILIDGNMHIELRFRETTFAG